MSATINSAGVACCGNCGSELEVRCSAGCANPDIEIREDPLAIPAMSKRERSVYKIARGICSLGTCDQPVAPREHLHGRPPTRCIRHLELARAAVARSKAKKAAA